MTDAEKLERRRREEFCTTLNDLASNLPKGRGRCFDIGSGGGCGVLCGAFMDGECEEPQEITREEVEQEYDADDSNIIFTHYKCYQNQ